MFGRYQMNLFAGLEEIVKFDEPMSNHTWYKLGGPAKYFIEPKNEASLLDVVKRCHENEIEMYVLGRGSNLLVKDSGVDGAVVYLNDDNFGDVQFDGTKVVAQAGVDIGTLIGECARKGLRGIECMVGIPGSVGGAIRMNAGGSFGDIASITRKVSLMDRTGFKFEREREEIFFGYRSSNIMAKFILGATFELIEDDPESIGRSIKEIWMFKKSTQPLNSRNAGCVFKNPRAMSSGALIEKAGLAGSSKGGAIISDRHANFICAGKGATSQDVLNLIDMIRKRIKLEFDVDLEMEIEIWG